MDSEKIDLSLMKILLVDDIPANLNVLVETLKNEGYNLSFATSGEIALTTVEKFQPDLILLDIMMPGIDGFETCQRLKQNQATKHIPVIFITAKTDTEDIVKGFTFGGVDYITKPFRQDEVLARVRTHLTLQKILRDKDELIAELKDTQEILENSARIDLLTGLYNRKDLEEKLDQEKHRSELNDTTFSIALAGIDSFSDINGEFGEYVGNHVLIRIAAIFSENIRQQDFVGRWTGSHFLVILPQTSLQDSRNIVENLRAKMENEKLDFDGIDIPFTLSFGIAEFKKGIEINRFLQQTESELRSAKKAAKNQVIIVEPKKV
jgi:diguanylate cyclase (GGDEF)-like protein